MGKFGIDALPKIDDPVVMMNHVESSLPLVDLWGVSPLAKLQYCDVCFETILVAVYWVPTNEVSAGLHYWSA
jgi:hypothetical protein